MAKKRNVKDETYNKLTLNVRKVNIAYKENSFKLSLIVVSLGKGSKNFLSYSKNLSKIAVNINFCRDSVNSKI